MEIVELRLKKEIKQLILKNKVQFSKSFFVYMLISIVLNFLFSKQMVDNISWFFVDLQISFVGLDSILLILFTALVIFTVNIALVAFMIYNKNIIMEKDENIKSVLKGLISSKTLYTIFLINLPSILIQGTLGLLKYHHVFDMDFKNEGIKALIVNIRPFVNLLGPLISICTTVLLFHLIHNNMQMTFAEFVVCLKKLPRQVLLVFWIFLSFILWYIIPYTFLFIGFHLLREEQTLLRFLLQTWCLDFLFGFGFFVIPYLYMTTYAYLTDEDFKKEETTP